MLTSGIMTLHGPILMRELELATVLQYAVLPLPFLFISIIFLTIIKCPKWFKHALLNMITNHQYNFLQSL